jgi:uncharacterized protein YbaA (DUF1428 family)
MHIQGFVIPVPAEKRDAYLALATWFDQALLDLGALQVVEAWETLVEDGKRTDFRRAVAAEPGEKIVFAWIVWPDKDTASAAHEKIHEDERFQAMTDIPFDGRRMIVGEFESILKLGAL